MTTIPGNIFINPISSNNFEDKDGSEEKLIEISIDESLILGNSINDSWNPILNNNSDGIFCGAIDPEDKDFNLNDAIALTGKAGSISIHHARLLHGSATNKSSSRRMMLFYELSAADSWPLVGAPSYMKFTSPNDLWKQMKSQLISGEISTCPRMENIPVRIPLPPPSDHGSIFKIQKTGNSKSAFM